MAVLALTSCLNEHPKDQLDEDAIYGSASEIYTNAVASLYNYIGGYFRRILCRVLGRDMAQGLVPDDMEMVGSMAADISYRNAKQYFNF